MEISDIQMNNSQISNLGDLERTKNGKNNSAILSNHIEIFLSNFRSRNQ